MSKEQKLATTAKALRTFIYEESVVKGKPFIDFEAKTIEGDLLKLSSINDKYIYLTFWSSGCGPCRMENKFISKNYHKIPDDLCIVSFSIDKNAEAWKNASEIDSIAWINVSDNLGSKGKIKTQYQVQAIPTSFLIDDKGIVIEKFTGFDCNGDIIKKLKGIILKKRNANKLQ